MTTEATQATDAAKAAPRRHGWFVVLALCVGAWLVHNGFQPVTPPMPSAAEAFAAGPGHYTEAAADPLPPAAPVAVRIPGIEVDAPVLGLGLARDGSLDVPPAGNGNVVSWYKDGAAPGAKGTAIVAGHVDNARGPAVFYALGTLKKGQRVEVARSDGRTAVFTVDAVEVYENADFPDDKVYGNTDRAELRVITCGGGFSAKTGYQGNVVAYAHLIGVK
ncbi:MULTISPECIES: class F sortase [unclassified Streptomyces]|uniref:class F sortase n=1 Tax=unclassified Streptomyces TaxID=2593676 RepID=UPI002E2C3F96|nr:class F sortase [Streptomyces sp. NBC_01429]